MEGERAHLPLTFKLSKETSYVLQSTVVDQDGVAAASCSKIGVSGAILNKGGQWRSPKYIIFLAVLLFMGSALLRDTKMIFQPVTPKQMFLPQNYTHAS